MPDHWKIFKSFCFAIGLSYSTSKHRDRPIQMHSMQRIRPGIHRELILLGDQSSLYFVNLEKVDQLHMALAPFFEQSGSMHEESHQNALLTTPPSTRMGAPVVAEAKGLQRNATIGATSSQIANR